MFTGYNAAGAGPGLNSFGDSGAVGTAFTGYLDNFVICYMDDVLIFSKTPEEHLVHLTKVLERLHTHKFKVRFDKCFWGRKELEFLGHHLSGTGISPSPSKVKVVSEWERPKDLHELRVFLGFVNFYRKYIPNYSKVARPLNDFTKKACCMIGHLSVRQRFDRSSRL